jgi:hypothetical protein
MDESTAKTLRDQKAAMARFVAWTGVKNGCRNDVPRNRIR